MQSPTSERASKPLAHALDATLTVLLDERISQFRGLFEEIDVRFDEHESLIKSQQRQINQLRNLLGMPNQPVFATEDDGNGVSKRVRVDEETGETLYPVDEKGNRVNDAGERVDARGAAKPTDSEDDDSVDEETFTKQIVTAADLEALKQDVNDTLHATHKSTLQDVEDRVEVLEGRVDDLEHTASETEKFMAEDQDARNTEIDGVNGVLRDMELILESRDLQTEARRRAYMESQVRKVLFRMGVRAISRAFIGWKDIWQRERRTRYKMFQAVGLWRRRRLGAVFGPWARWSQHLQSKKMQSGVARVEEMLATEVEHTFIQMAERVEAVSQGMWSEDRVEELESRIERNNEQFQQEMEEEVEQCKTTANEAAEAANSAQDRIDNEIITWLEAQRQQTISAGLRKVLLQKMLAILRWSLSAWREQFMRKKHMQRALKKSMGFIKNRSQAQGFYAWVAFMRAQLKATSQQRLDELAAQIMDQIAQRQAQGLSEDMTVDITSLIEEQFETLIEPVVQQDVQRSETLSKLQDYLGFEAEEELPEKEEIDKQRVAREHLPEQFTELVTRMDALEGGKPGAQVVDDRRERGRKAYIQAQIRVRHWRYRCQKLRMMFNRWVVAYQTAKKNLAKVMKSIRYWRHGSFKWAFDLWKNARAKAKERHYTNASNDMKLDLENIVQVQIQEATESVVKSFHDGNETVQQMAELKEHNVKFTEDFQAFQEQVENLQVDRRRLKIDRTIRKVLSKLMYKFIAAAFSGWKAKVMRKLRIANLRNKVVWRMEHLHAARAFDPWLIAARREIVKDSMTAHQALDTVTKELDEKITAVHEALHAPEDEGILSGAQHSEGGPDLIWEDNDDDVTDAPRSPRSPRAGSRGGEFAHIKLTQQQAVAVAAGQNGDTDALRNELTARLEHLEVTLREDFQHVEVRCDLLGRQIAVRKGETWESAEHPREQLLSGRIQEVLPEVHDRFQLLDDNFEKLTETLKDLQMNGVVVERMGTSSGTSEPEAAAMQSPKAAGMQSSHNVAKLTENLASVFELKTVVEVLGQTQEGMKDELTNVRAGVDAMRLQGARFEEKIDSAGEVARDIREQTVKITAVEVQCAQSAKTVETLDAIMRKANPEENVKHVDALNKNLIEYERRLREVEDIGRQLEDLRDSQKRVESNFDDTRAVVQQMNLDISTVKKGVDVAEIKTEMAEVNNNVQAVVSALPKLIEIKSEVDTLTQRYSDTHDSVRQLNEQFSSMPRVSEVEGIKTEVASVRDRLLTMSTGLTEVFELKANVDFMSKRLEHSQVDEIPRITADMRVLQDSQSVQVKRVDELANTVEETQQQFVGLKSEVAENKIEKRRLGEHLTQLAGKLDQLNEYPSQATPSRQSTTVAPVPGTATKSDEFSSISRRITEVKMEREQLLRAVDDGDSSTTVAARLRDSSTELASLHAALEKIFEDEATAAPSSQSPVRRAPRGTETFARRSASSGRGAVSGSVAANREQAWQRAQKRDSSKRSS